MKIGISKSDLVLIGDVYESMYKDQLTKEEACQLISCKIGFKTSYITDIINSYESMKKL